MNNSKAKIVHISDPHFGTEDPVITNCLIRDVNKLNPDVIILSGDLTQRALKKQFLKASNLIKRLKAPKIVIPGNHDIPLYNFIERFINPFGRYKKYISTKEYPEFNTEHFSIIGVNTSTPFRSQKGRIKEEDIAYLQKYFFDKSADLVKGVVVHHNAFPFEGLKGNSALENTNHFLSAMNKCGVDFIFAGHLHRSIIHSFNEAGVNNNLIMLQAGTCVSSRLRKENNTFLVIKSTIEKYRIDFYVYNGESFQKTNSQTFDRTKTVSC